MFLIILPIIGIICALIAHSKGRNPVGWFFIGFFFGFVGLIIALVVSNVKDRQEKDKQMEMQQRRLQEQLRQERLKNEQFRKHAQSRLDVHDEKLDIDTRLLGNEMNITPLQITDQNTTPDNIQTIDVQNLNANLNNVSPDDKMENGWFYNDGSKNIGPITFKEIQDQIYLKQIYPDTYVWHNTFTDWTFASNIANLKFGGNYDQA